MGYQSPPIILPERRGLPVRSVGRAELWANRFDSDLSEWTAGVCTKTSESAAYNTDFMAKVKRAKITTTGAGPAYLRNTAADSAPIDLSTAMMRLDYTVKEDAAFGGGLAMKVISVGTSVPQQSNNNFPLTAGRHIIETAADQLHMFYTTGGVPTEWKAIKRFYLEWTADAADQTFWLDEWGFWEQPSGKARIAVSSDGSYQDVWRMAQLMEGRGWRLSWALTPSRVQPSGSPTANYLSEDQVLELYRRGHVPTVYTYVEPDTY